MKISKLICVNISELHLFSDHSFTRKLSFPDNTNIMSLGLKEGDIIHISNKERSKDYKEIEDNNKQQINSKSNKEKEIISNDKSKIEKEKPKETKDVLVTKQTHLTSKCNHPETSKCLYCMQTPNYKGNIKYNCNHPENVKCPNCANKDIIEDVKHLNFDEYLNKRKAKCKGTHGDTGKCNNCTPPLDICYKMNLNCRNHEPYPKGLCVKCMPPAVVLSRQPYRHVDYVSFMNSEDLQSFIQSWQKKDCLVQQVGFLFGYFAEDPNYSNGIRAVIEYLYIPPQKGDHDSSIVLQDKNSNIIDEIADALSLEFIGWIFTTINTDKDNYMCSYDIKKAAIYQEQYKLKHNSGYFVSKFITVMVKPKEDGNIEIECCMISDQFQALVRDNVIGDCIEKNKIPLRKPEKNELLPDIFQENKKVTEFDPSFAIVQVSNFNKKRYHMVHL